MLGFFSAYPLWDVVGVPTTRVPMNVATSVSYILPPVLLYFFMAVLAITPKTRALRVVSWPVLALLALRATLSVDTAPSGYKRKFHNDLANPMTMILTRSIYWAFAKEPLVKRLCPANGTLAKLVDAFDLAVAFRGHEWDWSRGLYVPRETRPSNHAGFVLHTALSVVIHAFVCSISHRAIRSFSPTGLGSISGGSIFDETLPFHLRYFRSSVITILSCFTVYGYLQLTYDICTIVGVVFLRQHLAQWPPGFDSPWRSTSLHQFWGRRWHQWLRHIFLVQGGYPLSFFFGRTGLVVGTFLSSGVYHHLGMNSLDSTSELWRMLVGFGMMAPGMFVEQVFKWSTGSKVSGLAGWVWTMTWLVLWGNVIVDGFLRAGLLRFGTLIDDVPPLRALVERVVMDFDTWLHSV